MKKKIIIILFTSVFFVDNFSQNNSFGYPEDTLIRTVSLNVHELHRLRRLVNDPNLKVDAFNLDSILNKHNLTMADLQADDIEEINEFNSDKQDDSRVYSNSEMAGNVQTGSVVDESSRASKTYSMESESSNTHSDNQTAMKTGNSSGNDEVYNSVNTIPEHENISRKYNSTSSRGNHDGSVTTNVTSSMESQGISTNNTKSTTHSSPGYSTSEFSRLSSNYSSKIVFRVQVAAAIAPITRAQLSSNYSGPGKVEYFTEDNWYKYIIAEETNYQDALQVRNGPGVHHAFIAAYYNNQKLDLYNAIRGKRKPFVKRSNQFDSYNHPGGLVYMVQVAACRSPLSKSFINYIYKGEKTVYHYYSEGWHRYRIHGGEKYSQAEIVMKSVNIPGAFVVPLLNGKKITIKDALEYESRN